MTLPRRRRPPGRGQPPGRRSFLRAAEAELDHLRLIRLRTAVLFAVLWTALTAVGFRLVMLHVVQAPELERIAERQQLGTVQIEASRGRLLDRLGRPLAVNVEAESAFALPSKIDNHKAFIHAVAPVVGQRPADLERKLVPDRHFAWLARRASPAVVASLRAMRLGDQIGFLTEAKRSYPNGTLASHVIGFAGVDNQGLEGAELAFEETLRGRPGSARIERDAMGRPRFDTRAVVREPAPGADVMLTIDQVIQHIAERELDRAAASTGATSGTVLVMDPRSGELLAMAAHPRYDPNAVGRAENPLLANRAISAVYEPGSTFKIILAAAAMEADAVTAHEVFTSTGELRVAGGYVIREARGRKFPRQTLGDIIRQSSNVGAAMVAMRLGKERYHEAIRRFGFGAPTGIDLPGELAGLVPPPTQWLGPGLETIGFGQGISVTPLQLLVAASALGNEGRLVRPHVLRAVRDPEGRVIKVAAPEPGRQATTPEVARAVVAMMEDVVNKGTGTLARVEGYRIAGKTGTAQKPAPGGGYMPDAVLASFVGLVPADNPRLAVLVILDGVKGEQYGGTVAAPVFQAIATQVLWHMRLPPSEPAALGRLPPRAAP
ncbi:MAG: penicillin-binding protein 2 [Armatimonadetes bacterium]|nr:penicillin-binding protein 2 [Armatimonadota bacterium]